MNRIGVLDIAIPGYLPATPFARFGLIIPLALALLTVAAGVISMDKRR
jgi:apolipoprotein N-acyltransferase